MNALQAAILGLVQGLTEFLPISSSAHVILTSYFLGWPDQGLGFDIAVHLGSMLAVVWFVRKDLTGIGHALLSPGEREGPESSFRRLALALFVGTIPVALGGLAARGFIGSSGRLPGVIATTSILFGIVLYIADRAGTSERPFVEFGWRDGLIIGLGQALALVPGTSRAGITITVALILGYNRVAAARFSFLLAIPVSVLVAGRQIWDLADQGTNGIGYFPLALGFTISAVSAYLAIVFLVRWVARQSFSLFVVYRVALGLLILLTIWF